MEKFTKPSHLKKGDTVAVISPSWAGPSVFPWVYENGLKVLNEWELTVKEFPMTRDTSDPSLENARLRAKDINDAFADPEVKAIFASIGGDDSIRILPFLNTELILSNPKIIIGYSDSTTFLAYLNTLGLVTFNGPSIMAGFSQMESLPEEFKKHTHEMLFTPLQERAYPFYETYCDGYLDWTKIENLGKVDTLKTATDLNILQGEGVVSGRLFGGCFEIFEFIKGTKFYPEPEFFDGAIFYLETSEEVPTVRQVRWALRNYGAQGIFERISALVFGRARGYSDEEKLKFNETILQVISIEFENTTLPIITNVQFGHTDPQITLPNGIMASINLETKEFKLLESPTI